MGSLPELRHIPEEESPHHTAPRRSFGAAAGLQVRPAKEAVNLRSVAPKVTGQTLTPALLEIHGGRRRESCSSSVGAASVRRLVHGGRGFGGAGGGAQAPRSHWPMSIPWTRRAIAAIVARFFAASSLLVLQTLQGSFGPWLHGSLLLTLLHGSASMAALLAPAIVRAWRPHRVLTTTYLLLAIFFALHLYPKVCILLPAYMAAGLCWTPMSLAHDTMLGELAASEGYSDTQTTHGHAVHQISLGGPQIRSRTLLRRLTRASRFARDCGLIMAAVVLSFLPSTSKSTTFETITSHNNTTCSFPSHCSPNNIMYDNSKPNLEIDNIFHVDEAKNRTINVTEDPKWIAIENEEDLEEWREQSCGYRGCPGYYLPAQFVDSKEGMQGIQYIPYALCAWCAVAAITSLWCWCHDSSTTSVGRAQWQMALMSARDTKMKFVAPLAFFIGLEQGFFYAHFLQWYVVCVFGNGEIWHVVGGAAFLRALVAATLSMLLAHGRRRLVAGVGLVWHACLLLALGAWRAADTDRNLPPGMAAAWAGCGAVWDILLPTIVDERIPGGRTALGLSLRSLGLSIAMCARATLCARWALRVLFLALPACTVPLLFIPRVPHR